MTVKHFYLVALSLILAVSLSAQGQIKEEKSSSEVWLPTLLTSTPQEGFELAVVLARKGVSTTQSDKAILMTLREAYARDPDSLTSASHVIAVHFQTIAAANNYWRNNRSDVSDR